MAKKEAGGKSSQQNDFLEPLTPTSVSATDVGTNRPYNDGAASVSFSLPELSPAATSFTATATAAGQTTRTASGPSSPLVVEGLASGVSYSVTVTATNAAGTSASSAASTVTATTVPQAPQNPSAVSTTANQDVISWSDGNSGGKAITRTYFISTDQVENPGEVTMTTNPWTEPEVGGSSQSYTLFHENANGTSLGASTASVTTIAPFFPPFFPPYFPPYFPPFFPPYFPPYFPPFFPPYFPPYFPPRFPYFPPFFPPFFPPYFPPRFPFFPPRFTAI